MGAKVSSGGGGGRRDTTPVVDPNVIPFIDIMLVLLIIFMVTAPMPTVDVRVDLPPRNPNPINVANQRPTFVNIMDGGPGGAFTVDVDGVQAPIAVLADRVLAQAIINNSGLSPVEIYAEARIFLRADQNTAYGHVITVMSRLQEEGFAKVGIFAEQAT